VKGSSSPKQAVAASADFSGVKARIQTYWTSDDPVAHTATLTSHKYSPKAPISSTSPSLAALALSSSLEPHLPRPDIDINLQDATWQQVQDALLSTPAPVLAASPAPGGALSSELTSHKMSWDNLARIRSLTLINCGLTPELALSLPVMPGLETLDVSRNHLRGIGDPTVSGRADDLFWLAFAPHLKTLVMHDCGLASIPPLLAALELKSLDVSGNELVSIMNLDPVVNTLQEINLAFNGFQTFSSLRLLAPIMALRKLVFSPNPCTVYEKSAASWRPIVVNTIPQLEFLAVIAAQLTFRRLVGSAPMMLLTDSETSFHVLDHDGAQHPHMQHLHLEYLATSHVFDGASHT
jgi:hypothetical protein